MKYFLTGATGFVGGEAARQLRAAGHEVVALVRTPSKAQELAQMGCQLAPGDVTEKETMRAPMTGVDGVFHIAGWYKLGAKDPGPGVKVNIEGTRNVLEMMRDLKIPKGVYTSTLAINSDTHGKLADETYHFEGKHLSEYDRTKAEAHKIAEAFMAQGLPLVVVMPGLIYGPGDTSSVRQMLVSFLKGQLPTIPNKTAYSWAHVQDVARVHILAMEKGRAGESYIVCGPTHTLVAAIKMASEASGKRMPMIVPPGIIKMLSGVMGVVEKVAPVPDSYTSEGLREVAGTTYIGDNSKAKRELGYNPRPLEQGWRETVLHEMSLLN